MFISERMLFNLKKLKKKNSVGGKIYLDVWPNNFLYQVQVNE